MIETDLRKIFLVLHSDRNLLTFLLLLLGGKHQSHQILDLLVGVLPHQDLELVVVVAQMDEHLSVLHLSLDTAALFLWALVHVLRVSIPSEVMVLHVLIMVVEGKMRERTWF